MLQIWTFSCNLRGGAPSGATGGQIGVQKPNIGIVGYFGKEFYMPCWIKNGNVASPGMDPSKLSISSKIGVVHFWVGHFRLGFLVC